MSTPTTRTVYRLEALTAEGWTVISESHSKPVQMNRLAKLGTPESIAEYGLCAARIVTAAGKLVARLPETGAFATVTLTQAQCRELAAERGEAWTEDEEAEAAAREAAVEAAKTDTRVIPAKAQGEKRSNVIGGLKRRAGTDARGFAVAVGDAVTVKAGHLGIVGSVEGDAVHVAWASGTPDGVTSPVPARKVTIVTRKDGAPLVAVDAAGVAIQVGDRCRSPWSGRVGTIEEIRPTGDVMMRHDANGNKVRHPSPSLVVIGHAEAAAPASATVAA